VLDLGCGSGIPISQILVGEGLTVYGLDASPTLVAAFREHFPDAPVACEAVEDSTFFHRLFDGIVAWGLLFLLPPETQVSLLQRMAAALTAGGRLLFTAPAQACTWRDALTGWLSRSLGAEAYKEILVAAGLSLIGEYDDEGQNHYYDAARSGGTSPSDGHA
jgi:2-polyprenyl-3-methyl-5-hydroxy-6-metoxy-1,4-benzoquinol methylase